MYAGEYLLIEILSQSVNMFSIFDWICHFSSNYFLWSVESRFNNLFLMLTEQVTFFVLKVSYLCCSNKFC